MPKSGLRQLKATSVERNPFTRTQISSFSAIVLIAKAAIAQRDFCVWLKTNWFPSSHFSQLSATNDTHVLSCTMGDWKEAPNLKSIIRTCIRRKGGWRTLSSGRSFGVGKVVKTNDKYSMGNSLANGKAVHFSCSCAIMGVFSSPLLCHHYRMSIVGLESINYPVSSGHWMMK